MEALTKICSDLMPASFNFSQTSRVPDVATTESIISASEIAAFKSDVISTFYRVELQEVLNNAY